MSKTTSSRIYPIEHEWTAEQLRRNSSPAAIANSLQKQRSLRPESLLSEYARRDNDPESDARVIIDQFWNPSQEWKSDKKDRKSRSIRITYVEALDV